LLQRQYNPLIDGEPRALKRRPDGMSKDEWVKKTQPTFKKRDHRELALWREYLRRRYKPRLHGPPRAIREMPRDLDRVGLEYWRATLSVEERSDLELWEEYSRALADDRERFRRSGAVFSFFFWAVLFVVIGSMLQLSDLVFGGGGLDDRLWCERFRC
jgi:hypothetical protein